MVVIDYDSVFLKIFKKLDKSMRIKIEKAIIKIMGNTKAGKPMRFVRKGTREVYISPFDLNIENKQIEVPLKPMIRFGTPIKDHNGKNNGIIIGNCSA